jgi:hypothetical protein
MVSNKSTIALIHAVACMVMFSSCQADPRKIEIRRQADEILAIQLNNGLSRADAKKIITFYFEQNISGCGFPDDLQDEGEYWAAYPRVGVTGSPDKNSIRLHKRTGRISWVSGPTYDSLKALTKAALTPAWLKVVGNKFEPPLA